MCQGLALGSRADSQVSSQVHAGRPFRGCRLGLSFIGGWVTVTMIRRHSACVCLGWVTKRLKTCVDVRANLISTKVSAVIAKQRQCTQCRAKQVARRPKFSNSIYTYPENSTLRWNRSSKFLLPRLVSRHCLSFVTDLF